MKREPELKDVWLPLTQTAAAFGLTPEGFRRFRRPFLPDGAFRPAGRTVQCNIRMAFASWIDHRISQAAEAASDSELLAEAGRETPALARGRLARARLLELELAERRHQLAEVETIRPAFSRIGATLRRTALKLQRTFGDEAHALLMSALDDADRTIDELETIYRTRHSERTTQHTTLPTCEDSTDDVDNAHIADDGSPTPRHVARSTTTIDPNTVSQDKTTHRHKAPAVAEVGDALPPLPPNKG